MGSSPTSGDVFLISQTLVVERKTAHLNLIMDRLEIQAKLWQILRQDLWSLWRNRLARSAVNRKVGGSSPPRDFGIFFTSAIKEIMCRFIQTETSCLTKYVSDFLSDGEKSC